MPASIVPTQRLPGGENCRLRRHERHASRERVVWECDYSLREYSTTASSPGTNREPSNCSIQIPSGSRDKSASLRRKTLFFVASTPFYTKDHSPRPATIRCRLIAAGSSFRRMSPWQAWDRKDRHRLRAMGKTWIPPNYGNRLKLHPPATAGICGNGQPRNGVCTPVRRAPGVATSEVLPCRWKFPGC